MKTQLSYLSLALVLASMASLTGCQDYLSQTNPNKTSTDIYWQDLEDTQSGLFATYAVLRNEYVIGVSEEAVRSDLGWPGYNRPVPDNAKQYTLYTHQYNNSTAYVIDKWDGIYVGIWRANQVIEALESLKGKAGIDEVRWNTQMGQARFMRGLFYFYLHNAYNGGSVVLRESTPKSEADFHKPLSPANEVLDFYRADLFAAYELIPYAPEFSADLLGVPTKGAAAVILGTSYLYEKNYKEAKKYFVDLITDSKHGYRLEQDVTKLFTKDGEFNSESIFEVNYSLDHRPDMGPWDTNAMWNHLEYATVKLGSFYLSAWMSYAYKTEPMDMRDPRNTINGKARPVSLRASSMVTLVQDNVSPYYGDRCAAELASSFAGKGAAYGFGKYKKYSNHDILTIEPIENKSGKNVILNRLSDVYLMYAECLIQEGDLTGALKYINDIRRRWGLVLLGESTDATRTFDGKAYDATSLMNHLMYVERPLELSVEGSQIRWQDLRRWGLLENNNENIFFTRSKDTYYTKTATVTKLSNPAQTQMRAYSTLTKDPAEMGLTDFPIDYEYDLSYRNYRVSSHAYFPIPNTEVMNNSNID